MNTIDSNTSTFISNCTILKNETKERRSYVNLQTDFINSLQNIGLRLKDIVTKEEKSKRLIFELFMLNFNLPARVWLPLYEQTTPHIILRIPYTAGCILNSKEKAPYCIYVEILPVDQIDTASIPEKLPETYTEENKKMSTDFSNTATESISTSSINDGISDFENAKVVSTEVEDSEITFTHFDTIIEQSQLDSDEGDEDVLSTIQPSSTAGLYNDDEDSFEMQTAISGKYEINGNMETAFCPAHIRSRLLGIKEINISGGNISVRRQRHIANTLDDPSAFTLSEPWHEKEARLRRASPYGNIPNWRLMAMIVKTGEDLRQEYLAFQLLSALKEIWQKEDVPVYVRPYKILICSNDMGLIEPIPNACSLHQVFIFFIYAFFKIKKHLSMKPTLDDAGQPYPPTILSHFLISYGSRLSESFMKAQQNFVQSCAAYCLISYFLQVKDRYHILKHMIYFVDIMVTYYWIMMVI